jgi:SAM-dependent methyltransferase
MAHPAQFEFIAAVKAAFPHFFEDARVVEIGSLDINGSVRPYFTGGQYTGVDLGVGPGVDVVCEGQDFASPDGSFDVAISCEAMEHNPYWRETFENMLRMCRPGGLVIMTCATSGRPEHGTSRTSPQDAPLLKWEYYRNLRARDFRRSIPLRRHLTAWTFCSNLSSCDLYFVGFKAGAPAPKNTPGSLAKMRRHYLVKNLCNVVKDLPNRKEVLVKRVLISIVGEQR